MTEPKLNRAEKIAEHMETGCICHAIEPTARADADYIRKLAAVAEAAGAYDHCNGEWGAVQKALAELDKLEEEK